MESKKKPKKRPRVEETGVDRRKGVTWRRDRGLYVVEMRVPNTNMKLHCGTYKDVNNAMIARDCVAYIRNSTGKEAPATMGGYNPAVHPSIYEFQESPEIFGSLEGVEARCEEWKRLLKGKTGDRSEFKKDWSEFKEALREDIRVAIQEFQSKFPQALLCNGPLNHVPNAIPLDGELRSTLPPSSSEVRVSPSPGSEVGATMGDGSMNSSDAMSVESLRNEPLNHVPRAIPLDGEFQSTPPPSSSEVRVSPSPGCEVGDTTGDGSINSSDGVPFAVIIVVNGSLQTLLAKTVRILTAEEIFAITKAGVDKIGKDIEDKIFGKLFEEAPSCTIDPNTIPPLK